MSTSLLEPEELGDVFRRRLKRIDEGRRATVQRDAAQSYNEQVRQLGQGGGYGANGGFAPVGGVSDARNQVLSQAARWIGTPYSWGGGNSRGPSRGIGRGAGTIGFDCSGLVQNVYAQLGMQLPRTARQQATVGRRTTIANLKPGDLVAWNNGGHIAIYAGNGMIIEAPRTGLNVRRRALGRNEPVFGVALSY